MEIINQIILENQHNNKRHNTGFLNNLYEFCYTI